MFDFPNNPTIGQQVVVSANGACFTWDGSKWYPTTAANMPFLAKAGGTMTGALVLAADPVSAMQPVTLQYLNAHLPVAGTTLPLMDGTANAGTGTTWSRVDHQHPSDTTRVAKSGDTMTGMLTMNNASISITSGGGLIMNTAAGLQNNLYSRIGGLNRWIVEFADGVAESGSNNGSNFTIYRCNDAGTVIDYPFNMNRADGTLNLYGVRLTQNGGRIISQGPGNQPSVCAYDVTNGFASAMFQQGNLLSWGDCDATGLPLNSRMTLDRNSKLVVGGNIQAGLVQSIAGRFLAQNSANYPSYAFYDTSSGQARSLWLSSNAIYFGDADANGNPVNGRMWLDQNSTLTAVGNLFAQNQQLGMYLSSNSWVHGYILGSGYYSYINGVSGAYSLVINNASRLVVAYDGTLTAYGAAYKPGGGVWADSSDLRTKEIVRDYRRGLDDVVRLNPVVFRKRGNERIGRRDPDDDHAGRIDIDLNREHIGLVAQEVADVMPEMVGRTSGTIDDKEVDDLLTLDASALIYALVNAVKELSTANGHLSARIARLEHPNGASS